MNIEKLKLDSLSLDELHALSRAVRNAYDRAKRLHATDEERIAAKCKRYEYRAKNAYKQDKEKLREYNREYQRARRAATKAAL